MREHLQFAARPDWLGECGEADVVVVGVGATVVAPGTWTQTQYEANMVVQAVHNVISLLVCKCLGLGEALTRPNCRIPGVTR